MASLTVSLSPLVSSFHSSLSLFPPHPTHHHYHRKQHLYGSIKRPRLTDPTTYWLALEQAIIQMAVPFRVHHEKKKNPRNSSFRGNCDKSSFSKPPTAEGDHTSSALSRPRADFFCVCLHRHLLLFTRLCVTRGDLNGQCGLEELEFTVQKRCDACMLLLNRQKRYGRGRIDVHICGC